MTTTRSTKNAWLKTIITTESARSSKIRAHQSMLYTVNVVLGPIRVPCSTRESLTRRMDQQIFVANKSQQEAKNRSSKQLEMPVVPIELLIPPVPTLSRPHL